MTPPCRQTAIAGVHVSELQAFGDDRGRFAEMFRVEWFPQRAWQRLQVNRSQSVAGTLRGLHYHRRQADYWHCLVGRLRAGLYDLRRASPTRGTGLTLELDGDQVRGLLIPPGVAHGFYALTDATLIYVVDNYYDGADELGVAWDDPALGLDWGLGGVEPILSGRDAGNPRLADIDPAALP